MEADTLDRLQRLTKLYRRGYRSPVIDQALGKLVVLEVEQCRIELQRLKARLVTYEQQYDMPSDEFYRRFKSGDLGDDMDFVEWSAFWDMFLATQRRLDELAACVP